MRYEYKMACFAEFRGEDEVALKCVLFFELALLSFRREQLSICRHYQDSYSTLVNMFGSTAILPPRTKRWAEAKVLADCINIKVRASYVWRVAQYLTGAHRYASYTCTTTNMPWLFRSIPSTCESLVISPEGGV